MTGYGSKSIYLVVHAFLAPWRLRSPVLTHCLKRGRVDKVNAELVVLTYGTIVAQLCKDFDGDYVQVNKQLDKMGYNIGLRLIEDYLAKSNTMRRCSNFRETADMLAKVLTSLLGVYRLLQGDLLLIVYTARSGLRSFSISHQRLRIGPVTTNSSHSFSRTTP